MPKTASIRDLEQTIESLPQADQFRLLETLLKHLKCSLFSSNPPIHAGLSTTVVGKLRGALKQYANPVLKASEENAFAKAMKAKHANS